MEKIPRSVTLHDFYNDSDFGRNRGEYEDLKSEKFNYDNEAANALKISDILLSHLDDICQKCTCDHGKNKKNHCACSKKQTKKMEKLTPSNSIKEECDITDEPIKPKHKIDDGGRQKNDNEKLHSHRIKFSFSETLHLQRFFNENKPSSNSKKKANQLKHSASEYTSITDYNYVGNSNPAHKNPHLAVIGIDECSEIDIDEIAKNNLASREDYHDSTSSTSIESRPSRGIERRSGAPFNASFSSWLQLFLLRKRQLRCSGGAHMYHPSSANPSMIRTSVSLSVVHEAKALGSDGESLEVSPCTSDQMSTSSFYQNCNYDEQQQRCYVPNVKMRQKQPNRRWSEQDIQKRLSLPADIKLPQTVVDKLNRTPTLDNPLTRKSRRASLSEIGFGKLETYKKLLDLGEGTYATVYLGKSLLTGKSVALKEIRLEHEEGAPCTAIREVSLLRNLRHANVVTLHDVIYTDRILTLVFEFVEHDLREYMEEVDGFICMNNVKLFLIQLLRGLAYCHKRRILHRDLKPQNLLINRAGELKLADFGLARAQSVPTKTYSNEVVTLWYRPPDVLLGSTDYSTHIDMWGVGCILYEMLAHKPMFPGSTTDEQLNLIFQKFGTPTMERDSTLATTPLFKLINFKRYPYPLSIHLKLFNPPRITSQCTDLLQKMLRYEGRCRVSAIEAMRSAFFSEFPQAIFNLPDTESVLSLPGISYVPELHNYRKGSQT